MARSQREPTILHAATVPTGSERPDLKGMTCLPYSAYCHGEEVALTDRYKYQPHVRDKIYLGADVVVANADSQERACSNSVPESRIVKITPGVDLDRFRRDRPRIDRQWNLKGKKIVLTCALDFAKRTDLVLRAMPASGRIAGYSVSDRWTRARGAKAPETRCGIGNHGFRSICWPRSGRIAPGLLQLMRCFAMPNRENKRDLEGFGMVFLEAMQRGTSDWGRSGERQTPLSRGKQGSN